MAIKLEFGCLSDLPTTMDNLGAADWAAVLEKHRMSFHPRSEVVIDGREKPDILRAIARHFLKRSNISLVTICPQVLAGIGALVSEMFYSAKDVQFVAV